MNKNTKSAGPVRICKLPEVASHKINQSAINCGWYVKRISFSFVSTCFKTLLQGCIKRGNNFHDPLDVSVCTTPQNFVVRNRMYSSSCQKFKDGHYTLQDILPLLYFRAVRPCARNALFLVCSYQSLFADTERYFHGRQFPFSAVFQPEKPSSMKCEGEWQKRSHVNNKLPVVVKTKSHRRNIVFPAVSYLSDQLSKICCPLPDNVL
jgi:hypothetical protein